MSLIRSSHIYSLAADVEDVAEHSFKDDVTTDLDSEPLEHMSLMQEVAPMNPTRYDDEVFENEHSYIEINQPHIAHQQVGKLR